MSVEASVTINQTKCGCDGAISINAYNGTPPYMYSIDSGLTFKKMPFFTNLCEGIYFIIVKDSNDYIYNTTFTLNPPSNPTTYVVKLQTTSSKIVDNLTTKTTQYITSLQVTPSLPENSYITFDLVHSNLTTTSPTITGTTFTTNSTLVINSATTSATTIYTAQTFSTNTISGCQDKDLITTTTTEKWENVTYYNDYEFEVLTTTTSVKNGDYLCYVNTTNESYTIDNLKIFGCTCCNVNQ
jgi:hypothetical protein